MRLLDYKNYDVELHDGYVWFDAPLRDKPSGNLPGARLPAARDADARAGRGGPARLALHLHLAEHAIDLYPDQVWVWKIDSDGPAPRATRRCLPPPRRLAAHARCRRASTARSTSSSAHEDVDLVANVQAGSRDARLGAGPAVGPRGGGRLVRRPGARRARRGRVSPASRRRRRAPASASSRPPSSASPATASTRCGSPASRWTRASRPRSSTTTSRPARPCWSRRSSTPSSWPATCASARRRATRPTTRTGWRRWSTSACPTRAS